MAQSAVDGLLASSTLLERTSGAGQQASYRYAAPLELQGLLSRLEQAYQEQRLAIVQIMSSNALERMRSAAARRLADAFRLEIGKK
jgi:hypothetical protein